LKAAIKDFGVAVTWSASVRVADSPSSPRSTAPPAVAAAERRRSGLEAVRHTDDGVGASCLVNKLQPDTEVTMANGTRKPIKDVKRGCWPPKPTISTSSKARRCSCCTTANARDLAEDLGGDFVGIDSNELRPDAVTGDLPLGDPPAERARMDVVLSGDLVDRLQSAALAAADLGVSVWHAALASRCGRLRGAGMVFGGLVRPCALAPTGEHACLWLSRNL
jgi:hypothetical protein